MKAFTRKLSDPGPIELHDHYIFEEREAERDRLEAEHEAWDGEDAEEWQRRSEEQGVE